MVALYRYFSSLRDPYVADLEDVEKLALNLRDIGFWKKLDPVTFVQFFKTSFHKSVGDAILDVLARDPTRPDPQTSAASRVFLESIADTRRLKVHKNPDPDRVKAPRRETEVRSQPRAGRKKEESAIKEKIAKLARERGLSIEEIFAGPTRKVSAPSYGMVKKRAAAARKPRKGQPSRVGPKAK